MEPQAALILMKMLY